MKRESWLAALLVGVVTLLVVSVCTGKGQASKDAEAAQILKDSLAVLAPGMEAAKVSAAQQDTLVAELRATLEAERTERVAERAQIDVRISDARQTGAAALDSARVRVNDEVGRYLDEHEAEDSVMIAGFESKVASLEADTVAMALELVETRRQVLFAQRGWKVTDDALVISIRGSAQWEAAYYSEKRSGKKTKVVAVLVAACVAFCPRPGSGG